MSNIRNRRVAGAIRKHLSAELAREVADPRVAALAIQDVRVTPDLSVAQVAVRLMFGDDGQQERQQALAAMNRMAPGLRASLAPVVRMRRVPELRFSYDERADIRAEIDGVLGEIKREDEEKRRALSEELTSSDGDTDER
ncbi:MAG: 30S ribosome-binding factor RbfA [Polyangiaceae bacterium]|nr:30S ribosome-binding factor RbfA [Polyangiaceae bacterium]